jgi:glycosyltransferase 2 family protein
VYRVLMAKRTPGLRRMLRLVFVLVAVVLGGLAVGSRRAEIAGALDQLHPLVIVLAGVCVVCGTLCALLAWRALLADLGSPLPVGPAARVFFLAQLGKYLPGSVWPLLAQVELGREHHVPPRRSAVVGLMSVALSLAAGLVCAALTLPLVSTEVTRRYGWALLLVPLLLAATHPRLLNPVLARVFRLVRREPPEPLTLRGVGRSLGWSALSWLWYALQVWLIIHDLGATGWRAVPLAVGAFAFAWCVGFLAVFAPAGAGVREAVLTLALAPALAAGPALVVALVSRVLMSAADLLLAGLAVLGARRQRRTPADVPLTGAAPGRAGGR